MQLELSAEDAAFRDEMRAFFTTEVPEDIRDAVAGRRELTKEQVVRSQRTLNAAGIAVPHWPVEWGGRDWSALRRHIWHEEMQRACVPPPLAFNASMVGPVIATFGNREQKERFLAKTANLDIWWSQGFSEPDAGSDLASLRTAAVRDGDEFVVNGQKTWTTLGQHGDWIFCLVRTDPNAKIQEGISFLLIDMKSPGVTVRPIITLGGEHEVNEVWLENVKVPVENRIYDENKGWTCAKFLLAHERSGIAGVARSKRGIERIRQIAATELGDDGQPLLADPAFKRKVADLEIDLTALEYTELRTLAGEAAGKGPGPESSLLKIKGTEIQQRITELVLEAAGHYGAPYFRGFPDDGDNAHPIGPDWAHRAAPTYFNVRKTSIYGGSNEIQRNIIAKMVLGL